MEEDNGHKRKEIREGKNKIEIETPESEIVLVSFRSRKLKDEGGAEASKESLRARTCSAAYAFVNRVEVGNLGDLMPLSVEERRPESLDADWHSRLSSLNVPNKYKQFCKLACDGRVPVRAVVGAKDWSYSLECSLCGDIETTMHCLKECHHASAVWSTSCLSSRVIHLSSLTFREFFRDVTRVLKDDTDLSLFVLICWCLWEARNEHEEQHIVPVPDTTLNKALLLLEQAILWRLDKLEISSNVELARSQPRMWSPPPKGWLKMNVEVIKLEHMMAMGAVVREDNGHALAAISACNDPEKDLLTAKALALKRALSLGENAVMLRHQKVVVELTCELIVECLAEFMKVRSVLYDELRRSLESCLSVASRFSDMKFAKVSAQENRLAYYLASKAVLQECEESWVTFDAPDWLKEAIAADLPD